MRRKQLMMIGGASLILVGGAIAAAIAVPKALAAGPQVDEESTTSTIPEVKVNDAGETYGPGFSCPGNEDPDLIQAMATNGSEGYVRRDDLTRGDGSDVSSPEEAVAYMQEKTDRITQAVAEELSRLVPDADLDRLAVSELLLECRFMGYAVDANGAEDAASESACERYGITSEQVSQAYEAARERIAERIPVYESDGVTIIGEFVKAI